MRRLRGGVFTSLALFALLPFVHSAGLMGWSRARSEIGVVWYVAEGISLLLGVSLFVTRAPERLRPGSFDIWAIPTSFSIFVLSWVEPSTSLPLWSDIITAKRTRIVKRWQIQSLRTHHILMTLLTWNVD